MTVPDRLGKAVDVVTKILKSAGVEGARLDARLIVTRAAGWEPQSVLIYPERELSKDVQQSIMTMIERRMKREPMSHIFGEREFWSLDFTVNSDTLTPRPDTETLIEAVLGKLAHWPPEDALNILDLGTGSGCILLSLLSELPNAHGVGIDLSTSALDVAKMNAQSLGLSERSSFQQGCWGDTIDRKFDVVVSNPPYIPTKTIAELSPEVAVYEPKLALDGGEDGLDAYRSIANDLRRLLRPGAFACFEVGIGQAKDVGKILMIEGLCTYETFADLGEIDRVVMVKADF